MDECLMDGWNVKYKAIEEGEVCRRVGSVLSLSRALKQLCRRLYMWMCPSVEACVGARRWNRLCWWSALQGRAPSGHRARTSQKDTWRMKKTLKKWAVELLMRDEHVKQ